MAFQRELGQLSSVRRVKAKNPKTWSDYIQPYLKGNQSCSSVVIRTDVQRCPLGIVSLLSDGCRTLSSTHTTYHDCMEEKRAEACNQSWLRCYQPATGCLLLMDLDARWCVMFSYMTTVIYEVCLWGRGGEGRGSVWNFQTGVYIPPSRFSQNLDLEIASRLHAKLHNVFEFYSKNSPWQTGFKLSRSKLKLTHEFIPSHQLSAEGPQLLTRFWKWRTLLLLLSACCSVGFCI